MAFLWNVKKMTAPEIVKEIFNLNPNQSPQQRIVFDSKVKLLREEIKKLAIFDLPVRKGKATLRKT